MEDMNQFQESRSGSNAGMEQKFEQCLKNAVQLQQNISHELMRLQTCVGLKNRSLDEVQNNLSALVNQLNGKNGTSSKVLGIPHLQNGTVQFTSETQKITEMFKKVYCILGGLVNDLSTQVNNWKSRFQLHYAKLMAEPDLEKIARWCAQTGKILHELLHVSIKKWKDMSQNMPQDELDKFETDFNNLLTSFLQRTFLVSKQENFFVKTENKKFQTFVVRVLAADHFYAQSAEVTAHFISECDLKTCFHGDDLNIQTLKEKEIKLNVYKKQKSPNKHELKTEKGTDKMQCCFQNLQFEKPFKRQQTKESKQAPVHEQTKVPVHEEKFRMVFMTKMDSKTYWTVSLPLVVISASSQETNGLASIMWQCFSTNVFSLQDDTPDKLFWSTVAKMLRLKMSMICESYNLTDENITHLRNRLFGEEDRAAEELVSLTQFCVDNMQGVNFSFWKWFLGVYNLLDEHLREYWSDGLIMGFVKRKVAEEMLRACDTNGTFIIRFSDKLLTDRDGYKNVYGQLTASVRCKMRRKNIDGTAGSKRKSNGQPEMAEEWLDVEHFEMEDCPPMNLANVLKAEQKPFYRFLYPSGKSRKETFDRYLKEKERKSSKYRLPSDLTMEDLEEDVRQMDLGKKDEKSVALEQDVGTQTGPRTVKKARRSNSKEIPMSDNCNADGLPPVSPENQSQLNLSPTSCAEQSPGALVQSPAQTVPASMIHLLSGGNQDAVVPNSPYKPGLQTVLEDMTFETENGNISQENLNIEMLCDQQSNPLDTLSNADMESFVSSLLNSGISEGEGGDISAKGGAKVGGADTLLVNEKMDGLAFDTDILAEECQDYHPEIQLAVDDARETIGNGVMEYVPQESEDPSSFNSEEMDPEILQVIMYARMLKVSNPAKLTQIISLMKEEVSAMETNFQNTTANELSLEDNGAGDDIDNTYSVDELFNLNLSPFEKMTKEF